MSVAEALELLRRAPGEAMPVLRPESGEVLGVLSRGVSYLPPAPPPRLGGMATPLGVYLTDGVSSGGAGFWGLFLSGVTLGCLGLMAQALVQGAGNVLAGVAPHLALALPAQTPSSAGLAHTDGGRRRADIADRGLAAGSAALPADGRHPRGGAPGRALHRARRPAAAGLCPRHAARPSALRHQSRRRLLLFRLVFLAVWSAVQASPGRRWTRPPGADRRRAAHTALLASAGRLGAALAGDAPRDGPADSRRYRRRAAGAAPPSGASLGAGMSGFGSARRVWNMGMAQVLLGYAGALRRPSADGPLLAPRLGNVLGVVRGLRPRVFTHNTYDQRTTRRDDCGGTGKGENERRTAARNDSAGRAGDAQEPGARRLGDQHRPGTRARNWNCRRARWRRRSSACCRSATGRSSPKADIAGPGFINFTLRPDWLADILKRIEREGDAYGRSHGRGRGAKSSSSSSRPTRTGRSPSRAGATRPSATCSASCLQAIGNEVTREYYINDALNSTQMNNFGRSVFLRYRRTARTPADGRRGADVYKGEYITDVARRILESHGNQFEDGAHRRPADRQDFPRTVRAGDDRAAEGRPGSVRRPIRRLVQRGHALHAEDKVQAAMDELTRRGHTYEKDGALWLRTMDESATRATTS